jgi:hypothetical protein
LTALGYWREVYLSMSGTGKYVVLAEGNGLARPWFRFYWNLFA